MRKRRNIQENVGMKNSKLCTQNVLSIQVDLLLENGAYDWLSTLAVTGCHILKDKIGTLIFIYYECYKRVHGLTASVRLICGALIFPTFC